MGKSKHKKEGTNQPATIPLSKNTELLPVIRQKLINLCEKLKQEKLTPWLWFNSRGVKVTKFDGAIISMSGCTYEQSQANVFWDSIEPFLRAAIVTTLDETIVTCHARGLKPEEPYIRETAMLLDGYLIDPIYRYMVEIDRRIRGKGNPKSVGLTDVTDKIDGTVKFLDRCKDEIIQGIKDRKQKEAEHNNQQKKGKRDNFGNTDSEYDQNINIKNSHVIIGDVRAKNVQTRDNILIHKHTETEKKKKGIFRNLWLIITAIVGFLGSLLGILSHLGWLESIKVFFSKLFIHK
jgi:hypothetical protein